MGNVPSASPRGNNQPKQQQVSKKKSKPKQQNNSQTLERKIKPEPVQRTVKKQPAPAPAPSPSPPLSKKVMTVTKPSMMMTPAQQKQKRLVSITDTPSSLIYSVLGLMVLFLILSVAVYWPQGFKQYTGLLPATALEGAQGVDGQPGTCTSSACPLPPGVATETTIPVTIWHVTSPPEAVSTTLGDHNRGNGSADGIGGFYAGSSNTSGGAPPIQTNITATLSYEGSTQVTLTLPYIGNASAAVQAGGYIATGPLPIIGTTVKPPTGLISEPVIVTPLDAKVANAMLGVAQLMPDVTGAGWYVQYSLLTTAATAYFANTNPGGLMVTPWMSESEAFDISGTYFGTSGTAGYIFGPVSFTWNTNNGS